MTHSLSIRSQEKKEGMLVKYNSVKFMVMWNNNPKRKINTQMFQINRLFDCLLEKI